MALPCEDEDDDDDTDDGSSDGTFMDKRPRGCIAAAAESLKVMVVWFWAVLFDDKAIKGWYNMAGGAKTWVIGLGVEDVEEEEGLGCCKGWGFCNGTGNKRGKPGWLKGMEGSVAEPPGEEEELVAAVVVV